MEEPWRLRQRPHHGGFPVPYVTAVVRGRPDFKVHDMVARARCGADSLCQLCGLKLESAAAFTGLSASIERRVFGEPPAHTECLDYAFEVCPFLAGRDWAKGWEKKAAAEGIIVIEPPTAPAEMGVLVTDRWWLIDDDEGVTDFKYQAGEPIRDIEWRKRG